MSSAASSSDYDYVIVGGGSAGCTLAARLSEDGQARVLLVEAGRNDRNINIRIPAGVKNITKAYDWRYEVEPDPSRGGMVDHWASGKVIGGGSSVNAMLWVRGNRADFDGWAAAGATGWDYESVLPYFVRTETSEDEPRPKRGQSGPVHVSTCRVSHPMTDAFVAAATEAGYPHNEDYNGPTQEGVCYSQVNQRRGWRSSTARAYLAPARRRPNLDVWLHTTARRVVVVGGRATAVELTRGDGTQATVRATREIVLSAGALATPGLLLRSGIGPSAQLAALGIPTVADSPQVGQNLQEHPLTVLLHQVTLRTLNKDLTPLRALRHGLDFVARGRGAVASPAVHAQLFAPGQKPGDSTWFQAMFSPFGVVGRPSANKGEKSDQINHDVHAMKLLKERSTTTYPCVMHPWSRGEITLRSSDPAAAPVIRHDLLADRRDLETLREAARATREVFRQPSLRELVVAELRPSASVESDDEWETYLRANTFRANHPVGTARMGNDDEAVVDPELRVRGVEGLRIVDASVMPTLPSANTNAATIMIAERASDLIRGRSSSAAGARASAPPA